MGYNCTVLIPARIESKRFYGKAVFPILGKPMIQWVWESAMKADIDDLFIVTDSDEIKKTAHGFGACVLMSSGDFQSGSDRIASVAGKIESDNIINIQADEPLITAKLINSIAGRLKNGINSVVTAARQIDENKARDADIVKVVFDKNHRSLYFSRSIIYKRTERKGLLVDISGSGVSIQTDPDIKLKIGDILELKIKNLKFSVSYHRSKRRKNL